MSENTEKTDSVWKKNEIGALWRHDGKNQKYLSGHITIGELGEEQRVKVLVFTNKDKDKHANAPDFRVYINPERQQKEASESTQEKDEDIPEGL